MADTGQFSLFRMRRLTGRFGNSARLRADMIDQATRSLPPAASDSRVIEIDPITRVGGHYSFRGVLDLNNKLILDARITRTLLGGYESAMTNRSPIDAVYLAPRSGRVDGWSSGANAVCASIAIETSMESPPPPLAVITRGLGTAVEFSASHVRHLFMMAGPDYSESVISRIDKPMWEQAERFRAAGKEFHGCSTIADIMRGLNPLHGAFYREALTIMRAASEVAIVIFGKHPHPSTVFPGGIGIEADPLIYNQILARINYLVDYAKKAVAIWDDLIDFFYQYNSAYKRVGELPVNLLSTGVWDDPEMYDARLKNWDKWGGARMYTPGIVLNGKLLTLKSSEINSGVEENPARSFYDRWDQIWRENRVQIDPFGSRLSLFHPWNKVVTPRPLQTDWDGKYSWQNAVRWGGECMETGPLAELWITALAGKLKNEFIRTFKIGRGTGESAGFEIDLPKFDIPARRIRWIAPERPCTLERNRAEAYAFAYSGVVALTYLIKAFNYLRTGNKKMSSSKPLPEDALGVGFWADAKGALMHHTIINNRKIAEYSILTASDWAASPADSSGKAGPCEQALLNTPILEEFSSINDFAGIDLLRTIRSFDL